MSKITVTLHCKPFVRQWLLKHYGEPVNLPRRSNFRHTFLSCLDKNFYTHNHYNKELYSASVEFYLHRDELQEHGHAIKAALQNHINDFIEEQMKNEMFIFLYAQAINQVKIHQAIRIYQNKFGFEQEVLSFDNVKQIYYRKLKYFQNIFRTSVTKTQENAITKIANQSPTLF